MRSIIDDLNDYLARINDQSGMPNGLEWNPRADQVRVVGFEETDGESYVVLDWDAPGVMLQHLIIACKLFGA